MTRNKLSSQYSLYVKGNRQIICTTIQSETEWLQDRLIALDHEMKILLHNSNSHRQKIHGELLLLKQLKQRLSEGENPANYTPKEVTLSPFKTKTYAT